MPPAPVCRAHDTGRELVAFCDKRSKLRAILLCSMETIIIAEDDSYLSEIVAVKLHEAGFGVTRVSDGEELLPTIMTALPALLLLDLALPNCDGFAVLAALRADAATKALPVVVFTNDDSSEVRQKAKELGATYFLKTLTSSGELVKKITELLAE